MPCYAVSAQPAEDPSWRDIPGDFRHLSPAQLERFGSIGVPMQRCTLLQQTMMPLYVWQLLASGN